ncbi:hypothetical protein CN934_28130 [Ensifer sp. MMN_5]|nr:hypothetical protein CN934_28130 [Ensifer sp. MMN_5]
MTRLSPTLATCLVTSLMSGIAYAQSQDAFDSADRNGNGRIELDELQPISDRAFAAWDTNGDNRIRGEEFIRGLHRAWSGEDLRLDESAFATGWRNWFEAKQPDFSSADDDSDGRLSEKELHEAVNAADLMGGWQGAEDGYLTPQEFRAGLKTIGDADGNGSVEKNEYSSTLIAVIVHSGEPTAVTTQTTSASEAGQSSGANIGIAAGDIIPLASWGMDQIYSTGWSAEALFDTPVYGASGDRIGDVEDLVVGSDGKLISLVAEVGGFWDIGDTHVSVPWDKVTIRKDGTAQIPVTEDTADQYGFFNDQPTQAELSENVVSGLDDQELGPRAWRASELIGDLARIRDNNQYRGYGYVSDLIFSEGRVLATIIDRDAGYGLRGPYALPYYGYGYGWTPGSRYYDLPYNREDASRIVPFDYDRL